MPFFLLSRDGNNDLRLLTPSALPSRQDALAALSKLTADSGFSGWDADVMLVDLDSATPVLLVRPAETATAEPEFVVMQAPELEEPAQEEQGEANAEDEPVSASIDEAESDSSVNDATDSEEALPVEESEAFASYVSMESDEVDTTDGAVSLDDEPSAAVAFPVPDLAMELEPESDSVELEVSPIETELEAPQLEAEPEIEVEAEIPVGESSDLVDTDTDGDDLREALERTTMAMEEEALTGQSAEPLESLTPQPDPVSEKWPWDTELAPAADPVTEPLDAEAAPEDFGVVEPMLEAAVGEIPDISGPADDSAVQPAVVSEFLGDLEPISFSAEPIPADAELGSLAATEGAVESEMVDGYVCADCVYVDTCPNKDERLPRDCGSFQWK